MKLQLVVLTAGKLEGKTFDIKGPHFLIGRDPDCHLRPASPLISKRHCALVIKDGKVYLKDFGSTNGSFVNDQQVKNAVLLKNGDKLKAGPLLFEVRLQVEGAVPQQAGKPTPQAAQAAAKPAPAVAKASAPPAPAAPRPAEAEPSLDDDEIAAMLLGGASDETVSDASASDEEVPQGTTVFDMPMPNTAGAGTPAPDDKGKKPEAAKPPQSQSPDTRSAAAAILDMMRKRPRG